MDPENLNPDENLKRIREIITLSYKQELDEDDHAELIELVEGLDNWINNGGSLPTQWAKSATTRRMRGG